MISNELMLTILKAQLNNVKIYNLSNFPFVSVDYMKGFYFFLLVGALKYDVGELLIIWLIKVKYFVNLIVRG